MGRKIVISYNVDPKLIGQEQVVDDADGAQLIREGRARWADTKPENASDPRARAIEQDDSQDDAEDNEKSEPAKKATKNAAPAATDGPPADDTAPVPEAETPAGARKAAKSAQAAATKAASSAQG